MVKGQKNNDILKVERFQSFKGSTLKMHRLERGGFKGEREAFEKKVEKLRSRRSCL